MKVKQLNKQQLNILKGMYLDEKNHEDNAMTYWSDIAYADENISDEEIFEQYKGVDFVVDDFGEKYQTIKQWYKEEYPDDPLGNELDDEYTFSDLILDMGTFRKFYYKYVANDSIIRERVFAELASISDVDYDVVYTTWLVCECM